MPIIEAHLLEGYASEEKTRLLKALTKAVQFVIPAKGDAITVLIKEYCQDQYMRAGDLRNPAPALPNPADVVLAYLAAMEARDLPAAEKFLAEDFAMEFPGTAAFQTIPDLVAWSARRYSEITKTIQAVEAFQGEETAVVFVRGTLAGRWPDGKRFDGVRFVDRFEVDGGKLTLQQVWNDLAEVRAQ